MSNWQHKYEHYKQQAHKLLFESEHFEWVAMILLCAVLFWWPAQVHQERGYFKAGNISNSGIVSADRYLPDNTRTSQLYYDSDDDNLYVNDHAGEWHKIIGTISAYKAEDYIDTIDGRTFKAVTQKSGHNINVIWEEVLK